jgi:cytochrome c-type biogenesis protein CcmH
VIAFIVICEVLTLLAFAWVLRPLWRTQMNEVARGGSTIERSGNNGEKSAAISTKASVTADEQARLAVYKDRRQEITSELELGRLSAEEAQKQQEDLVDEVAREFGETEVVRRSPVNRKSALALGLLGATLAALIYMTVGMPQLVENVPSQAADLDAQDPLKMIAELESKVASNPKDAPSWAILGAAYKYTDQIPKSVAAFEKHFALEPPQSKEAARTLAEFAEALALSNFAGRPTELLRQALKLDPNEPKSLAMMGAAQFRAGNLAQAKQYLGQLLAQMAPGSPQAEQLKPLLARIDEQLKAAGTTGASSAPAAEIMPDKLIVPPLADKPQASPERPPQGASPTLAKAVLAGRLTLSSNAKSADALKDVKAIFVSIKSAPVVNAQTGQVESSAAPSMPVAALKIDRNFALDQWPLNFSLSDDQSLRPQAPLSKAGNVILEVHLSRSGLPGKNSGDWFGRIGPIRPGAGVLEVNVDQQHP